MSIFEDNNFINFKFYRKMILICKNNKKVVYLHLAIFVDNFIVYE